MSVRRSVSFIVLLIVPLVLFAAWPRSSRPLAAHAPVPQAAISAQRVQCQLAQCHSFAEQRRDGLNRTVSTFAVPQTFDPKIEALIEQLRARNLKVSSNR